MTSYRLATTPADYRKCQALMREYREPVPLSFPTVMAERDGELIGFLSTHTKHGAVVAGPLVIREGLRAFTMVRLIEAYDRVMWRAGVKSYHFHVSAANAQWREQIERFGMTPWHTDEQGAWFKRELAHAA